MKSTLEGSARGLELGNPAAQASRHSLAGSETMSDRPLVFLVQLVPGAQAIVRDIRGGADFSGRLAVLAVMVGFTALAAWANILVIKRIPWPPNPHNRIFMVVIIVVFLVVYWTDQFNGQYKKRRTAHGTRHKAKGKKTRNKKSSSRAP